MTHVDSVHKGKGEERVKEDIVRLKEWLKKQPHLQQNVEDEILRAFVLGTKSLEIAKQKLDCWMTLRGIHPQLFSDDARNIFTAEWKEGCEGVKVYVLPKTTQEGYRVLWYQPKDLDKFNFTQMQTKSTMLTEYLLKLDPEMKGIVAVYDLKGIPLSLGTKLTIPVAAAALNWFQNAIPMKLKSVILMNAPSFAEMLVNTIFRPFMKEKLYKRVKITAEGSSFLKNIMLEDIIPGDYGGKEKTSDQLEEYWNTILRENFDWFKELSLLKSVESRRQPDKNHTFGVEGTFRSLAID